MNHNDILRAAKKAQKAAGRIVNEEATLDALQVESLGRAIRRAGTAIRDGAIAGAWDVPEPPDPPVDPGDPGTDPGDPGTDPGLEARTPNPLAYSLGSEGQSGPEGQMTALVKTFFPGKTTPYELTEQEPGMTGTWHGFQGGQGTLWHANGYNLYGIIRGLYVNWYGDWIKGREGHGLYLRCVPTLDMLVENYRARHGGGQGFQREWRMHETELPEALWRTEAQGGSRPAGTFTLRNSLFEEMGLIDTGTGGSAVRASWVLSLYNTGQHTIVQGNAVANVYSPGPHEGALYVGFGQNAWRTPSLKVLDEDYYCAKGDRAIVFLQGVDDIEMARTFLRGSSAYVDLVDNCKRFSIHDMPQDTLVRIKRGSQPHNAPSKTYTVAKGASLELNF